MYRPTTLCNIINTYLIDIDIYHRDWLQRDSLADTRPMQSASTWESHQTCLVRKPCPQVSLQADQAPLCHRQPDCS